MPSTLNYMDRNEIVRIYSEYSAQFEDRIGSLDVYNQAYVDFADAALKKQSLLDLSMRAGKCFCFH